MSMPAPSLHDGSDAGYETDSLGSGSTSISASLCHHVPENGRTYHRFREGAYNFPNDEDEQEREDLAHGLMMFVCQKLHFAPLGDSPGNILDLGTGTGLWAVDSEFLSISSSREWFADVNLQWETNIHRQLLKEWT